jgi:beta-lactam-binding protein with PASTA domain
MPNSGSPGQTVNASVTGLYSHFLSGLTQVAAGAGITIDSLSITGPTSFTAQLVIATSASAGPKTITVSTDGEVESATFTVNATVPNVVGDTQAAATTAITGVGLVVGTVTAQSSSTVAAGKVISQSPVGGTSVSLGSAVNLVISSGPPPVTVPNVVGDAQAAATTAITGVGLVVGTVTTQSSSTIAAGKVISQSPASGTSVNSGSAVNLVISSGPPPVTVPNVVGDTQAAATTAITGTGLVVGTVTTQFSSTIAAGKVISQSPVSGTSVSLGSAVNLVISSGLPPVTVPNVVGDTQAAATTAITGVGLVVGTVTTQSTSTVAAGKVISQSPASGTSVNSGSAVNLVISSGPPPVTVPNVVGDTQAAATTAITGAGLVLGTLTLESSSTVPVGDVVSQNPAAGTSANVGSAVSLGISTGNFNAFEAVSDLISVQSGTIGSQSLPTGENEAVSNLISIQNGPIGTQTLPTGENEAVSNLISIQNGPIGSQTLPAAENEAVSNLISIQNGPIGSQSLPTGKNEAVSNLISAKNGAASNATPQLKSASASTLASGTAALEGATLTAGETTTVTSDVPAQIFLNGQRAGNDPGSATDLTFVVPEDANSLRIRAGDSADSVVSVQPRTTVLTGQVVDENGAPAANVKVHLRHAGLEAEFFTLTSNTPPDETPSIAGLKPMAEEPASSLNLHNPAQALGYFPIGTINAPNFAVRFSGQFLAQASGSYIFFVAATEGAQLIIDGKQLADVHGAKPGLEAPVPVQLTAGWHEIELLAYSTSGPAELVLSFAPPGGNKQTINPKLLRAESTEPTALTDADGKFAITAPSWLDQIEAIATLPSRFEPHSGVSALAQSGVSNLGQIRLAPGTNF